MANTVTKTSLVDGEVVGVIHVYIASDGTSGDLSDEVILDASTLNGATAIKQIVSVESQLTGFSAIVEFDQTTDSPAVTLPSGEYKTSFLGTPVVNPEGSGTTGDVVLTTSGMTASGDVGHIVIKYRKHKA